MPSGLFALGKQWHTRLKEFFDSEPGRDAKPLEIAQAVLDDAEQKVHPVGRGRRIFPYNHVVVRVRHPRIDAAAMEATLRVLDLRLRERLSELQCDVPGDLHLTVACLEAAPPEWMPDQLFSVDYRWNPASTAPEGSPSVSLQIAIVKGAATEQSYCLTDSVVAIGRTSEANDQLGRVRRNHVAFLDAADGVTETVGRAHARLERDRDGRYRIFDEGSSNGTCIIRRGTVIPVPRRDPRGVRIESGDEIQLGRAVIRVAVEMPGVP